MSKRSREEKALFRGEWLAVQREQTAVLRRIAAVLEKDSAVKAVAGASEFNRDIAPTQDGSVPTVPAGVGCERAFGPPRHQQSTEDSVVKAIEEEQ